MVEPGEREHNRVFNIMEIQPFRRAAAIQAILLDADRVSLPTLSLHPMGLPSVGQLRTDLHVICM